MPYNTSLRLTDQKVSYVLHIRTLCPGIGAKCGKWGLENAIRYDDFSNSRENLCLARHEFIKKPLTRTLTGAPNTTITNEPSVKNTYKRTDFRVAGTASFTGGVSEYDLTIIAPTASVKAAAGALANLDPQQRYNAELGFREKEKSNKYSGKTDTPFVPLVISAGGYLTENSRDVFKKWRKVVPH